MSQQVEEIDPNEKHLTGLQKFLLFAGAVVCFGIWYVVSSQVHLPAVTGFSTSMIESRPTFALITLAIGIPLLSIFASLIAFRVRTEAGLFCCAVGLSCLAVRSGDIRTILLTSGDSGIFMSYMIELAFLGVIILASYELLNKLSVVGLVAKPSEAPQDDPDTLADRLTTVIGQAICVLVLMMLLGQSAMKGQAMASICAAGVVSSLAMHQTYKVRSSFWYLIGTLLAGIVAYGYCYLYPEGLAIGEIRGLLSGAGRSLPIHYASLGAAGTIFGYWTSLSWHAARKDLLVNA